MIHNYPYTDFNEYNLDWVITRIKELTEQWAAYKAQMDSDWAAVQAEWTLTREEFTDLRNYVNSFFDNLDVQQEINNKLDEMAEDGSLLNVIRETVESVTASTASAWLDDHVNPATGYVVDNSLSIAGAAADAKATGDLINNLSEITNNLLYVFPQSGIKANVTYNIKHGVITLNGTPSSNTNLEISKDFQMQAGTYNISGLRSGFGVYIQIYKVVGGALTDQVVQANGNKTFTLDADSTVRARLLFTRDVDATGCVFTPMLVQGSSVADFVPYYSAYDIIARNAADRKLDKQAVDVAAGTDLNDVVASGYYIIGYSVQVTNCPVDSGRRYLIVINRLNTLLMQLLYYPAGNKMYQREVSSGTWSDWKLVNIIETATDVAANSDLNDIIKTGSYIIGYSVQVTNCPVERGRRYLTVVNRTDTLLLQVLYYPDGNKMYMRGRSPEGWGSWSLVNVSEASDTRIIELTDYHSESTLDNVGVNLRVMSYNVANYNNDTQTYLSDEKLMNLRKLIYKAKADIIGLQENQPYIDSSQTKSSAEYIYKPIYPRISGQGGTCIVAKQLRDAALIVTYSNGRTARANTFTIGNKTLLIISTHPVAGYDGNPADSAASIAARDTQYKELFQWISGEITLKDYDSTEQLSCPTYDWCVICADTNSLTQTDRENLMAYAKARNFNLANGEYLGWIKTVKTGQPIDNIMVSENVIINSVEVLESLFDDLYSDHYPVIADLTLLDQ